MNGVECIGIFAAAKIAHLIDDETVAKMGHPVVVVGQMCETHPLLYAEIIIVGGSSARFLVWAGVTWLNVCRWGSMVDYFVAVWWLEEFGIGFGGADLGHGE